MVFKRKSRYPRRKKNVRSANTTRRIATKALKLAKSDLPEAKFNGLATGTTQDWVISTLNTGAGGVATVCNIPQGTLSYERIGNKIRLDRLHLNFNIVELGTTNLYRIIVVQLKQQASALSPAAILDQYVGLSDVVQARYTPEYRQKYKVLLDKTVPMGTAHSRPQYNFNFNKKLHGVCEFQDSSSVSWNNNIQVLAFSQNAGVTINSTINIVGGLYYFDA